MGKGEGALNSTALSHISSGNREFMIAEAVGLEEWVFKPLGLISLLGKSIYARSVNSGVSRPAFNER